MVADGNRDFELTFESVFEVVPLKQVLVVDLDCQDFDCLDCYLELVALQLIVVAFAEDSPKITSLTII